MIPDYEYFNIPSKNWWSTSNGVAPNNSLGSPIKKLVHQCRDNRVVRNITAPLVPCCIFSIWWGNTHSVGYKITFHWNRQFCQDIPVESCSWASDSFWSSHSISGLSVSSVVTKQSLQICRRYNPLLTLWSSYQILHCPGPPMYTACHDWIWLILLKRAGSRTMKRFP